MANSFTFRLTAQGVEQVKRDLEALGESGRRVFDGLKNAAPGLADGLNRADASIARSRDRLNQFSVVSREGQAGLKAFNSVVRAAGFQFGDFAVSVASGENALKALTRQGAGLLTMFGGPWGVVLGSAATVVGTLAAGWLDYSRNAETAQKQQDAFNKTLDQAAKLMERLNGKVVESNQALLGQRKILLSNAEAALQVAESRLAGMQEFIVTSGPEPGFETVTRTPGFQEQQAEVKRLRGELILLRGELQDYPDAWSRLLEQQRAATEQTGKTATATRGLTSSAAALTDTVAALLATFDPLPGSFAAYARAEAQLELQFERGAITAAELNAALQELAATQDALSQKRDAAPGPDRRELEEAANRQTAAQRELEQFVDQSADRIGNALTEGFTRGELSVLRLRDVGRGVLSELAQWALKLALLNPFKNWVGGGSAPTLASVFGGAGGLQIQTASGGLGSGSTGFGGFTGGGGLGSLLFGAPAGLAAGGSGPSSVIASTPGLFGAGGGGPFGAFLNTPLGGGLGAGLLGFGASLLSGQGLAQSAVTGGLTGIGAGIGSIFGLGPIGGVVGGLLGSLVGGLFGKKPKLKKYEAEAFIAANAFGLPGIESENESGRLGNLGDDLARLARVTIGDVLGGAGALMPEDLRARLSYYHSTKKGKTKSEFYKASLYDTGIPGLTGEIGRFQDAETAAQALAAGTLFMAGLTGTIPGTGASTGQAFQTLWGQAGRNVGNIGQFDAKTLTEMIGFTRWLDGLSQVRSESDAAAQALLELNAQLGKLDSQAADLGLDAGRVTAALRRDFAADITGELLALTDPQAFALAELGKEYAARRAVAETLGADLVELEQLYAARRQQILDQGLQGLAASWKDFINGLQFGAASALSPVDQLAQARAQYEASKQAGGATFRAAATTYLALTKDSVGSTQGYADLFAEVIALARQFGNLGGVPGFAGSLGMPAFAGGGAHAGGWMMTGERGAELVATGAARVFSHQQTTEILRGLTAPRGGSADGAWSGARRAANDDGAIAPRLAAFSSALERLALAQEQNNREQRLTREQLRG